MIDCAELPPDRSTPSRNNFSREGVKSHLRDRNRLGRTADALGAFGRRAFIGSAWW